MIEGFDLGMYASRTAMLDSLLPQVLITVLVLISKLTGLLLWSVGLY